MVFLLGFFWASETILGKLALDRDTSPFEFPLIMNIGTIIAVSLLFVHPKYRKEIFIWKTETFFWMLCVALSMVFFPYFVLFLCLREITPAEAAIITSLTPVFSLAIGVVLYGIAIRFTYLLALVFGMAGIALMLFPQLNERAGASDVLWYLFMLFVPLSYASSGYFLKKCSDLGTSYIQLLFITNLVSAILFFLLNKGESVSYNNSNNTIYMLAIAVNILAVITMLYSSRRMSPFALSFSNYSTLIFSFILSVLIFTQQFSLSLITAALFIFISSMLVQKPQSTYD